MSFTALTARVLISILSKRGTKRISKRFMFHGSSCEKHSVQKLELIYLFDQRGHNYYIIKYCLYFIRIQVMTRKRRPLHDHTVIVLAMLHHI